MLDTDRSWLPVLDDLRRGHGLNMPTAAGTQLSAYEHDRHASFEPPALEHSALLEGPWSPEGTGARPRAYQVLALARRRGRPRRLGPSRVRRSAPSVAPARVGPQLTR